MDWKLKLCQVLECFGDMEGIWYEECWERYGISKEERAEINQAVAQYEESPLGKELNVRIREEAFS